MLNVELVWLEKSLSEEPNDWTCSKNAFRNMFGGDGLAIGPMLRKAINALPPTREEDCEFQSVTQGCFSADQLNPDQLS